MILCSLTNGIARRGVHLAAVGFQITRRIEFYFEMISAVLMIASVQQFLVCEETLVGRMFLRIRTGREGKSRSPSILRAECQPQSRISLAVSIPAHDEQRQRPGPEPDESF